MKPIMLTSIFWALALGMTCILKAQESTQQTLKLEMTFLKKPPNLALVYAIDGTEGTIANTNIDQDNKEFKAPIYVVNPTTKITYSNSDSIDHNIYSKQKDDWGGFDIGLLSPKTEPKNNETDYPTHKMVRLRCKIHPKMRTYVAEIPTNHYEVLEIKKEGLQPSYEIKVPANTTKIGLMMTGYETMELDIASGKISKEIFKKGKKRGDLTISKI